jgi:hypothetical protein
MPPVDFELETGLIAAETSAPEGVPLRIDDIEPTLSTSDETEIAILDAHPGMKRVGS